jgi:hypothetical protein
MSMSSFPDRNRTMRSPSGTRVNALKRGSIIGSQSLLGQPFGGGMSDGRLSLTPSYATSIDEVSNELWTSADEVDHRPFFPAKLWIRFQPFSQRHQRTR